MRDEDDEVEAVMEASVKEEDEHCRREDVAAVGGLRAGGGGGASRSIASPVRLLLPFRSCGFGGLPLLWLSLLVVGVIIFIVIRYAHLPFCAWLHWRTCMFSLLSCKIKHS